MIPILNTNTDADTIKPSVQPTVIGTRAFAVSAAVIRNSLPTELRLTSSIQTFAWKLKTFCASLTM